MLSNSVESVLRIAGGDLLTETFIRVMILVFILALACHFTSKWKSFTGYTATLLTSLGILGTFAGILTGLLDFDSSVDQIDGSIADLLEGLKTAFTSSLVGMLLSVLYKILTLMPVFDRGKSNEIESDVTIESLYEVEKKQEQYLYAIATALAGREGASVLKQLDYVSSSLEWMQQQVEGAQEEQKKFNEKHLEVLEKTLEALSDDGESSLTGQLKLIRTDSNDVGKIVTSKLEETNTRLEEANVKIQDYQQSSVEWRSEQKTVFDSSFEQLNAVRLDAVKAAVESNEQRTSILTLLERSPTETLIAALEDVIRDFNKHISEQFGENFKELNVAVGRMIDWQNNYKSQVEQLQAAFNVSAASIGKCEQSMVSIEQSSESIPANMETLADVLRMSNFQLTELEAHLEAFADVKQRAVESVPELHGIVENVTKQVESSTTQMLESCKRGNDDFIQGLGVAVAGLRASSGEINSQLMSTAKGTSDEMEEMLRELRSSMEQQFKYSNEKVSELIDKEFKNMESARNAQTQKVMEDMGAALASITGKFTKDYSSLVSAMQDVVRLGNHRGG